VDLCSALSELHRKGIIHRDLKADNLLVAGVAEGGGCAERILLSDFGLARSVPEDGSQMFECCGSPAYAAPEILCGSGYSGTASDMWSVGVLVYMLLCGYPPFYADDAAALHAAVLGGRFSMAAAEWDAISAEAKHLPTSDEAGRPTHRRRRPHPPLATAPCYTMHASARHDDLGCRRGCGARRRRRPRRCPAAAVRLSLSYRRCAARHLFFRRGRAVRSMQPASFPCNRGVCQCHARAAAAALGLAALVTLVPHITHLARLRLPHEAGVPSHPRRGRHRSRQWRGRR